MSVWMIGKAMLALGNAELIGVEDTLSLRKIKKKGEEIIGTRWCDIWQRSWQSVQRTEENVREFVTFSYVSHR